jgi:hypothetical protein
MTRQVLSLPVRTVMAVGLFVALTGNLPQAQQATPKPTPKIPESGVSQIMTLEGEFIRISYNNEGYVTMGYRVVNESVGQDWMLLQIGTTVRRGTQNYKLARTAITVDTPDGKKIPMATNQEYMNVDIRPIEMRAKTVPDNINYFPPEATQACKISMFSPQGSGVRAFDDVELSANRACVGQIYFKIPGGIKYGQHWLNVQFQNSLVRVPFKVMTKEEEKSLSKSWKDIKKQVDEAFKKGGGL